MPWWACANARYGLGGLVAKKHEDTTISLHPLSFKEAIAGLVNAPRQTDSQAEESDSTKEAALMLRTPAVTIIACLLLAVAACTQPTQAAYKQTLTEPPRLSQQTEQRFDEACALVADRVIEVIPQPYEFVSGFEGYMGLLGEAFTTCLQRR